MQVVHDMPGEARMSEVLLDLVEPYLEGLTDPAEMRKVFMLGMAAWNIALFPRSAGPQKSRR
jgi:hypothetical protein